MGGFRDVQTPSRRRLADGHPEEKVLENPSDVGDEQREVEGESEEDEATADPN